MNDMELVTSTPIDEIDLSAPAIDIAAQIAAQFPGQPNFRLEQSAIAALVRRFQIQINALVSERDRYRNALHHNMRRDKTGTTT